MPLPLHVQLMCDMGQLEDALHWSIDTRRGGVELDPMHDALLYSGMVLLAVEGCISLCRHLERSPVLLQH